MGTNILSLQSGLQDHSESNFINVKQLFIKQAYINYLFLLSYNRNIFTIYLMYVTLKTKRTLKVLLKVMGSMQITLKHKGFKSV